MISDRDPFAPLLHNFLNVNCDVKQHPKGYKARQPLDFYERHIGTSLQLKTIKRAPWIPSILCQLSEDAIKEFTSSGHVFLNDQVYRYITRDHTLDSPNAKDVNEHYFMIVQRCYAFASKLLFHPNDRSWHSYITIDTTDIEESFYQFGLSCIMDSRETESGDRVFSTSGIRLPILDDQVMRTLLKLEDAVALYQYEFYSSTRQGENLVKNMGPCAKFKWETTAVTGAPCVPESSKPPDSHATESLFQLGDLVVPKSNSSKTSEPAGVPRAKRKVVVPQKNIENPDPYRMNVDHYIQKAWIHATRLDCTFIVFHCGRYERIGIRHRATQTLYLSDLISTTRMKGYGQMHLGLLLASVKDQLETLDLKDKQKSRKRKREAESTDLMPYNSMKDKATRRLRRRLNPDVEIASLELDKKAFDDELAKRDLILLHFNSDVFRSPAPSSFGRMERSCVVEPYDSETYDFERRASYPPESYISVVTFDQKIGDGAIGIVYKAVVTIEMSNGVKHRRNMVVKLAANKKREQMVREYEAYKQLAEEDVTDGIIGVHGLFRDIETGTLLMLMEDAGITLRDRALARGESTEYDIAQTTAEERDAYIRILRGIHSAKFTHADIRIDNLMVNANGDLFIIDFDLADYLNMYYVCEDMGEMMRAIGWDGYDYRNVKSGDESEDESEDDDLEDLDGEDDDEGEQEEIDEAVAEDT